MNGEKLFLVGWLIDGSGGPVQKKMVLKVVDGKFQDIQEYDPEAMNEAYQVNDLSHCTILPPLVDSHVHLFMSGTTNQEARKHQLIAGYDEIRPVIEQHLHYLFSHGVLAVRDGGDHGAFALKYQHESVVNKEMVLRVAGRAWKKEGRYGSLIGRHPGTGESLAGAYAAETEVVDHVKLVNSGLNSLTKFGSETAPQFTKDEIGELVKIAESHGKKVMVHANGILPVQIAIEAGCHSIEHGFFMGKENLQRMADKGTVWVPTIFTMKAYGQNSTLGRSRIDLQVIAKTIDHQLQQLSMARDIGVKVALGTDAGSLGVLHGESVVEEMKLYIKAGYTLAETVQCVTHNGAGLLGLDRGLIAAGKPADFLVARGTPAQLPRKLSYIEGIYLGGEPSSTYRKNPVKIVAGSGKVQKK